MKVLIGERYRVGTNDAFIQPGTVVVVVGFNRDSGHPLCAYLLNGEHRVVSLVESDLRPTAATAVTETTSRRMNGRTRFWTIEERAAKGRMLRDTRRRAIEAAGGTMKTVTRATADAIRRRREETGLSYRKLAAEFDVPATTVAQVIRGIYRLEGDA